MSDRFFFLLNLYSLFKSRCEDKVITMITIIYIIYNYVFLKNVLLLLECDSWTPCFRSILFQMRSHQVSKIEPLPLRSSSEYLGAVPLAQRQIILKLKITPFWCEQFEYPVLNLLIVHSKLTLKILSRLGLTIGQYFSLRIVHVDRWSTGTVTLLWAARRYRLRLPRWGHSGHRGNEGQLFIRTFGSQVSRVCVLCAAEWTVSCCF